MLAARQVEVHDCGTFSSQAVDYPDIAELVAESPGFELPRDTDLRTGIGIAIAANKIPE